MRWVTVASLLILGGKRIPEVIQAIIENLLGCGKNTLKDGWIFEARELMNTTGMVDKIINIIQPLMKYS